MAEKIERGSHRDFIAWYLQVFVLKSVRQSLLILHLVKPVVILDLLERVEKFYLQVNFLLPILTNIFHLQTRKSSSPRCNVRVNCATETARKREYDSDSIDPTTIVISRQAVANIKTFSTIL